MNWYLSYVLGMLLLLVGTVYFIWKKRKAQEQSAGVWFLTALFFTVLIWYLPVELGKEDFSVPESILSALFQSIDAITAGSYEKEIVGSGWFFTLYSLSIMIVRLVIILATVGIVLSIFNDPYQFVLNASRKKKKTYVFWGFHDKTVSIARSIADREDARLLFLCGEPLDEYKREVLKEMGALYFQKPPKYLFSKIVKDLACYTAEAPVEVFIFRNTEEENLKCLSALREAVAGDTQRHILAYLETGKLSFGNQNEIQQQYSNNGRLGIRFIRTEQVFAYNELYRDDLLENCLCEAGKKQIRVLMIGMDDYAIAILRTILWVCQLPGYDVTVCTVDSGEYAERLRYHCPALVMEDHTPGLASYKWEAHERVAYESAEYQRILDEYSDFTFAFIHTEDVIRNYNIASELRTCRVRNHRTGGYRIRVLDTENSGEIYSYSFLTNSALEKVAELLHDERQQSKKPQDRKTWQEYCRDAYMCNSVLARALGIKYKLYAIRADHGGDYTLTGTSEEWLEAEHMRWNVYSRTMGYIQAPEKDLYTGRMHPDMIPFGELSREAQQKDAIHISDAVIHTILEEGNK